MELGSKLSSQSRASSSREKGNALSLICRYSINFRRIADLDELGDVFVRILRGSASKNIVFYHLKEPPSELKVVSFHVVADDCWIGHPIIGKHILHWYPIPPLI